jgi:hypothetical protein
MTRAIFGLDNLFLLVVLVYSFFVPLQSLVCLSFGPVPLYCDSNLRFIESLESGSLYVIDSPILQSLFEQLFAENTVNDCTVGVCESILVLL